MEENGIVIKLEKIFREVFDNESLIISREMSANDLTEWNSLNHMILISEVENVFSIKFKLKELNKMRNVGDMIDIIISKL
jgi:acyl carrier protein